MSSKARKAVVQRRGLALLLAVGGLACAAPEAARGQATPSSATPTAAATSAASTATSATSPTSTDAGPGVDTLEMVSPDGTRKQVARSSVPESVGWGTDAEGRRVPVTRVELTDGPVREIRRYGPGGVFLDVTRSAPPPPRPAPTPQPERPPQP